MQKKLSKTRTTRLIDTTSKLYRRCCKEVGYSTELLMNRRSRGEINDAQFQEMRTVLDDLYCKYICELDNELLDDFLAAHVTGQIKRAQRTLDTIQKELLERAINEDNKDNGN